jgi:nucleoside 2-deoxyribosyltransferase
MVDKSDILIAVWDGTASGTGNTVAYAKRQGKPIWLIPPDPKLNKEIGWLNYTTV